ncbi:ABC transporter substrate-binding protein [Kitasatospora sp. NPDC058201]|uniref:ABC transporter substrate-binding protein n=1 Tax=unclassified Kitasatospora TaxID=2633591 RepID=UPI00366699EF
MRAASLPHRTLTAAAVGLLALSSLSACSGKDEGASSKEGASSGARSFTYWSMWRAEEPQAKVLKAAADKFTAETGIKVDLEFQGRDVKKKIGAAIAAHQAPDLWDQGDQIIWATTASIGQALDLSDVYGAEVPGEGKRVADVIPVKYLDALGADSDGKRRWVVPYELLSAQLFYNAADPLTATPPATWEDLMKVCDSLKSQGKPCIVSDGELAWENSLIWDNILADEAGEGTYARLANDKSAAAWDDPAVLSATKKIENLVKGGHIIKGYDASKYPAQQTKWAQGSGGFVMNGSWIISEVLEQIGSGWKFGAIPVPSVKSAGAPAVDLMTLGFSIPKAAKNPDPAKKFIAYFMKKDNLSGISTEAKNITPRIDIPAPAELADVQKAFTRNPVRTAFGVGGAVPGDYADKVFNSAYLDLWHGKSSAEQFIAAVKKAQVAYWKAAG